MVLFDQVAPICSRDAQRDRDGSCAAKGNGSTQNRGLSSTEKETAQDVKETSEQRVDVANRD